MNIEGKSAIVTGGGTGVGRATALRLAQLGCSVAINYSRSKDEAEATAADVEKLGVRAIAIQANVASDADCRRLADETAKAFGRLDVLVNNAGTTSFIPHNNLEGVKDEDWDKILSVNLKGPFQCIRAAHPHMLASGGGAIVNVSSVAGVAAVGSSIPYCASKGALNTMTVALARALAPKIRVNAVAPGFIATRWLKNGLGEMYDKAKERTEKRAPLQKVCEPEDVAEAVLSFIIGSDLVTGQIMVVDGGMLIGQGL
jgi:3-oxoacyl-[acyl-carrier protein] reductase